MKTKVLIIKLGYSETFDKEISRASSLGDVLRSTVILHLFKNDDVAWLTDEKAVPLLYNNPYISRILTYDFTTAFQVQSEMFDVVINLEKVAGICAMSDNIKAWKRFGFRFNPLTGTADHYMFAEKAMEIVTNDRRKQTLVRTWQASLYDLFGARWKGEEYILGYQPSTEEQYDIGFNCHVGTKWPTKAWKMENWKELEQLCKGEGLSVSWQEGLDNMYSYIDWINKCRCVVSNDSLGLHVAIALKKKTVGLFGATNEKEVHFYSLGAPVTPNEKFHCRPCSGPKCSFSTECINTISPEHVMACIRSMITS
ncbi:MAG: glycosyltransferase family 9 protein [Nitrospirae bacterium]|nr:glycosyltransferase family 9 protein [Nitrospirota bacterium]